MSLIIGVTERGEFVPPPEVLQRLRDLHPGLSLKHHPLNPTEAWSLSLAWREDDPRRAMIRSGEIGDAPFDVIGYVPTDVRMDDIPGYVERSLSRVNREDARSAAAAILTHNARTQDAHMDKAFEPGLDRAEVLGHKLFGDAHRVPKVYQSESLAGTKGRKRRNVTSEE